MASFWSFLVTFSVFMACFSASAAAAALTSSHRFLVKLSTISAAPALLPADAPLPSSPSLSPDNQPLFPTDPGAGSPSPTESLLPTIPSSPSPPNPDDSLAPGPAGFPISPSGSLPASSSVSLTSSGPLNLASFLGLLLFFLMQLSAGL